MDKNIAVIGCGYWGKNLVRNFSELGALSCVCDPDLDLAIKISSEYNINSYSYEEILQNKNIKGVVLAVPAPLHASMGIKAMNAGKHVYVEKPLAMNSSEAEDMINCSVKNDVHLMVGHLLQYHPVFRKLKELTQDGSLGNLKYIYSNRLSLGKIRQEEDVIWSFAPHDISMILSLAKEEPESVLTESASILRNNISDISTIHMKFKSDLKAHVSVSWLHPYKEHKLVLVGEFGMFVFDDTRPWEFKLAHYNHSVDLEGEMPVIKKSKVEYIDIEESEPLRNECSHFLDVINGQAQPITDGEEGLRVLRVLTAATKSQTQNLFEK